MECDGKVIQLPQGLQGLVFLNIPSYMAGTNFWGTDREKDVSVCVNKCVCVWVWVGECVGECECV